MGPGRMQGIPKAARRLSGCLVFREKAYYNGDNGGISDKRGDGMNEKENNGNPGGGGGSVAYN